MNNEVISAFLAGMSLGFLAGVAFGTLLVALARKAGRFKE